MNSEFCMQCGSKVEFGLKAPNFCPSCGSKFNDKKVAYDQWKYWNPDTVIIEGKASGLPLTYELRKMGIPVINYTPSKGNDKHARVNAVAPLFESGQIWAPDDKFAEEVIEECAAFPYGDNDDLVDSMTQAVMRFRQGGFIMHPEDEKDQAQAKKTYNYY